MSVFRATERRARKQHLCSFCHAPILPGELHMEVFWLQDGEPSPYRAHSDCQQFANDTKGDGGGIPAFAEADWWQYELEGHPSMLETYHRLIARADRLRDAATKGRQPDGNRN